MKDYEVISYHVTPTFLAGHKPKQPAETRMHYTGSQAIDASYERFSNVL